MTIESVSFNKSPFLTDPQMDFEELVIRVRRMGFSEDMTSRLLNKARAMPPGSLKHFLENITVHMANLNRAAAQKSKSPIVDEVNNGNDKTEQV